MPSFPDNYLPADPASLRNLGPTRSVSQPPPAEEIAHRYNVHPSTLEPRLLGTFFYLVSVGLVAAAIIIIFSIASFSLLHASIEMPGGSHIGGVFPHTHVVAAPAALTPAETKLPSSAAKAALRSSPTKGPAIDNDMRPPEASRSQPASERVSSGATEVNATHDDSLTGTSPMPSLPAEQRTRVFHEFEMYQKQKAKLEGDNAAAPQPHN